jgi:myo-inositol-1(or 4)-monophosphatase
VNSRYQTEQEELDKAVRQAGKIALSFFKSDLKSWEKNPGDPVSEADIAIDSFLKQHLLNTHPDYGWLSEETADDPARLNKSRVWIIDPIDGTRSFIAGKPEFTVCAALVEDGKPVCAAVFNPVTDEFFEATLGQGAFLNGEKLSCSDNQSLENTRLLASRKEAGGLSTTTKGQHLVYNQKVPLHETVISSGQALHPELMNVLGDFVPRK